MLIYASVRWICFACCWVLILFTREYTKHWYSFNLTISAVVLSALLKGKFCICYCEHFISWDTENKLSCGCSQTERRYWQRKSAFTVLSVPFLLLFRKTCVHLGLTLFKVSSAASFSQLKCLNINFGCLLAKCTVALVVSYSKRSLSSGLVRFYLFMV